MFQISDILKKRYSAFWDVDAFGRCCLYISKPPGGDAPAPPDAPVDVAGQWEDIGYRTRHYDWAADNTRFFADGFPNSFPNFGPGCLTAMIGGSYRPAEGTVWFELEQVIADWKNPPPPVLDEGSAMYRMAEALTQNLLESGKSYVSITDIGGMYDILAAMRGTQDLLTDLYDCPEDVKAYVKKLQPVLRDYCMRYSNRLIARQGGMTSWMPIWSEKTYYPLQCDFSAMISPDMFKEFILPDLIYQSEYFERSIYHMDGPHELPHLKHLLSIPRLTAIQWTPGAWQPDCGDPCWYDLYREIQAAGKGIVLLYVRPENFENLLKNVSAKGLYVCLKANDGKQARELIRVADCAGR
ncbi:MAG: hypothetical protein FWF08_01890 [Oscillospiraceae bacterium]|nr:hypothetical protein [Oscillospiraceae bacterium]